MGMSADTSVHALTGAYALDALDPTERQTFEAHLADCPACEAEVRDLLSVAARLGSAERVNPPPSMRAAVMARIDALDQESDDPARAADAILGPESETVVPIRRKRPAASLTVWLGVAAGILAVVAATLGILLAQSRHAQDSVTAENAAITSVLTAADARTVSGAISGGGHGAVVMSASEGRAVFLAQGLAAAPAGHTYELWFMTASGAATPAGTFMPNADGRVATLMNGQPDGAALVGVTVEPAGGTAKPTTTPVLAVHLPST
jgi:anti-sigma-K factor RskA